ncbi:group II intron maturase-specific domain-containing protein [Candidatus Nitrotoga sp. BS]
MAEVMSPLRDIDKWIRRKLRCYIWKQWGTSRLPGTAQTRCDCA